MKSFAKYKGLLYLIALIVIVPIFVWHFAIGDTVAMWKNTRQNQKQLVVLEQDTTQLQNRTINITNAAEQIQSGLLLETLLPIAERNNATVIKYTPYIIENRNDLTIKSAEIVVSGGYIGLVKIIDYLEKDIISCRIASVSFKSIKDRRKKMTQLTATLIVQQIIQID